MSEAPSHAENAAQAIPGWMTTEELAWLAEQAAQCAVVVNVGCWRGRSVRALCATPGGVMAVDDWRGEPDEPEADARADFERNLAPQLLTRKVHVYFMESVKAAAMMPDGSADMVFIDASHDYASVKADIAAWWRVVKPGGILCGHDAWMPDVAAAVEEAFGSVERAAGEIWVRRKP